MTIFVKLPPNSGHFLIKDKFIKTHRYPLFRGFTLYNDGYNERRIQVTLSESKAVLLVTRLNILMLLTIITKIPTADALRVLHPPLNNEHQQANTESNKYEM